MRGSFLKVLLSVAAAAGSTSASAGLVSYLLTDTNANPALPDGGPVHALTSTTAWRTR
jgi:hypothetical protein